MSNSVSLQFRNKQYSDCCNKSVVLFAHWGGMEIVRRAKEYVKKLNDTYPDNGTPLGRRDPEIVIVDFLKEELRREFGDERVSSSYYLERTEKDGDNWNNGHHIIELT